MQVPPSNQDYGKREYWNKRFEEEEEFDWLVTYDDVKDKITPLLKTEDKILIVGCGNSTFSSELYDDGYQHIWNLDYSEVVIQAMEKKHKESHPEMKWVVMDMTDMSGFEKESFDVVIDKAAMDALMTREGDVWNPNQQVIDQSRSMCRHISRILCNGGYHFQISFAQPHFRKKYLLGQHPPTSTETETPKDDAVAEDNFCIEFGWTFATETIPGKQGGCFHHFLYIMKKQQQPG